MICSLVYYKSPFHFNMRKYNPNFESFMDQIRSDLNSRYILNKNEFSKKMYVIYQHQSGYIYRAQIIDFDLKVESKLNFILVFNYFATTINIFVLCVFSDKITVGRCRRRANP